MDQSLVDQSLVDAVKRFERRHGVPDDGVLDAEVVRAMNVPVGERNSPADSLFERVQRDFSHGCVRVERPRALAQWVLAGQAEWTADRIDAAMASREEQHVALKRQVPVYIVYQTVWVDDQGTVRFAEDLYGHDARQLRLLAPAAPEAPPQRVARN